MNKVTKPLFGTARYQPGDLVLARYSDAPVKKQFPLGSVVEITDDDGNWIAEGKCVSSDEMNVTIKVDYVPDLDAGEHYDLEDYVDVFAEDLKAQLRKDRERWGDTWRYRPVEGQEDRMIARLDDYKDQYQKAGVEYPILKIAGEALICWVRREMKDWK